MHYHLTIYVSQSFLLTITHLLWILVSSFSSSFTFQILTAVVFQFLPSFFIVHVWSSLVKHFVLNFMIEQRAVLVVCTICVSIGVFESGDYIKVATLKPQFLENGLCYNRVKPTVYLTKYRCVALPSTQSIVKVLVAAEFIRTIWVFVAVFRPCTIKESQMLLCNWISHDTWSGMTMMKLN